MYVVTCDVCMCHQINSVRHLGRGTTKCGTLRDENE